MKKLLIFSASFAFLLVLLQISSGAIITMLYQPDPTLLTGKKLNLEGQALSPCLE